MYMRLLAFAVLWIGSSWAMAQPIVTDTRLEGVDSLLESVLDAYHVAGFSVAVVHKDRIVYAKGFGYRDYENKRPATANTLYAIGSCTKAFTAALLGKLFGDSLSLDDKVTRHLPELHFQDGRERDVTIRDLMTHRTGLTRYDYSWYIFNSDSRDSLLRRVKYMRPTADLRAKWQYNNFMFLAQGRIAEKMTGKTWEENIQEAFFDPLGMSRSNFDVNDMAADPDASLGYTKTKKDSIQAIPHFELRGMGPAGSINSSVIEMASWLKLWINGGKKANEQLIPEAYAGEAISAQMVSGAGKPGKKHPDIHMSNYGLAWGMGSYRGHYLVAHGGNIDGFSANTAFFPSDSLGIVVLSNQDNSAVPGVVRNLIADTWFELPFIEWNVPTVKKDTTNVDTTRQEDIARIQGTRPAHALSEYTGIYTNPAYGTFVLKLEEDTLITKMGTRPLGLRHYHYEVFELKEKKDNGQWDTTQGGRKINFHTGLDGSVESAAVPLDDPSGEPVVFKREPVAVDVSAAQLQAYVGTYTISGMTITVTVDDGVLFMDVPGQTNYETIAQGGHYFKLKNLDGFSIRFAMDKESGKAEALYTIQPNGTFKAVREKK